MKSRMVVPLFGGELAVGGKRNTRGFKIGPFPVSCTVGARVFSLLSFHCAPPGNTFSPLLFLKKNLYCRKYYVSPFREYILEYFAFLLFEKNSGRCPV